ncbi:MAG: phenylacetic acid degradation protein [Pseudomonadales bacterium]|nr:phenylacetic acid degradation protein [Pseudomonadales bacterium]
MTTLLTAAQVQSYLADIFPQFNARITALTPNSAILELLADDAHLRPGGTVSGPTLMALADAAMYVAILGNLGQVALAVTTNLNISFYRKAGPGLLRAEARLLKMGKRLAVGDVLLFGADSTESIAHASLTYSIPDTSQADTAP